MVNVIMITISFPVCYLIMATCIYAECPMGCSLCNGPLNPDCLACENVELYRDTTNRLSSASVAQCGTRTRQYED